MDEVRDYTKALEIRPFEGFIYNNRVVIYDKSGQIDLALDDYNRAIMLNSRESIFYKNRSNLLFKIGNFEQAARYLARSRFWDIQKMQQKKNGNQEGQSEF